MRPGYTRTSSSLFDLVGNLVSDSLTLYLSPRMLRLRVFIMLSIDLKTIILPGDCYGQDTQLLYNLLYVAANA
jgi:hypothetical protein